jgi:hypothetical protein
MHKSTTLKDGEYQPGVTQIPCFTHRSFALCRPRFKQERESLCSFLSTAAISQSVCPRRQQRLQAAQSSGFYTWCPAKLSHLLHTGIRPWCQVVVLEWLPRNGVLISAEHLCWEISLAFTLPYYTYTSRRVSNSGASEETGEEGGRRERGRTRNAE